MLTDIYFDDNVFFDSALQKSMGLNQTLIDSWRDYGRLSFSKTRNVKDVLNAVPANFRQRWMAYFAHYSSREIEIDSDELFQANNFSEIVKIFSGKDVSAYILAEGNHELILGDVLYNQCNISGLEAFTPSETAASKFYSSGKMASQQDLKDGSLIEDVWDKRFKGLAKYSNKIAIIDRYMVKNIFEDLRKNKSTSIEKFMQFISRDAKSETVNVIIYSSDVAFTESLCTIVDIESYLRNTLSKKPYITSKFNIEINICVDEIFGKDAHDRYIAFDKHVVEIGKGISIFRDEKIRKTQFNIKSIYSTDFLETIKDFSKNRKCSRTLR